MHWKIKREEREARAQSKSWSGGLCARFVSPFSYFAILVVGVLGGSPVFGARGVFFGAALFGARPAFVSRD